MSQKKLPVAVGKNPPLHAAPGTRCAPPIKRFATLKEGEDFISEIAKSDPEGVANGEYYVDAPEEMVNPRHK